ncbi:secreted antigen 1 [Babesia caballi]|uniref:Secreted antigen 1 n=1 Tax=Babesia caballi TaxID=5871 RepID=A0AAV4LLI5_BABCB|nr:secreted antigen 1 [Babesia caballi]
MVSLRVKRILFGVYAIFLISWDLTSAGNPCDNLPVPETLKDVLDLFKVLHDNEALRRQVELELKVRASDYIRWADIINYKNGISLSFQRMIKNAVDLRAEILSSRASRSHGKYKTLAKTVMCTNWCVDVILDVLPALQATMYFLFFQVNPTFHRQGGGSWNKLRCKVRDRSNGGQLAEWLTAEHHISAAASPFSTASLLTPGYAEGELRNPKGASFMKYLPLIVDSKNDGSIENLLYYLFFFAKFTHASTSAMVEFTEAFCAAVTDGLFGSRVKDVRPCNLHEVCRDLTKNLKSLTDGSYTSPTLYITLSNGKYRDYRVLLRDHLFRNYIDWIKEKLPLLMGFLKDLQTDCLVWSPHAATNAPKIGPFTYGFIFTTAWENNEVMSSDKKCMSTAIRPLLDTSPNSKGTLHELLYCLKNYPGQLDLDSGYLMDAESIKDFIASSTTTEPEISKSQGSPVTEIEMTDFLLRGAASSVYRRATVLPKMEEEDNDSTSVSADGADYQDILTKPALTSGEQVAPAHGGDDTPRSDSLSGNMLSDEVSEGQTTTTAYESEPKSEMGDGDSTELDAERKDAGILNGNLIEFSDDSSTTETADESESEVDTSCGDSAYSKVAKKVEDDILNERLIESSDESSLTETTDESEFEMDMGVDSADVRDAGTELKDINNTTAYGNRSAGVEYKEISTDKRVTEVSMNTGADDASKVADHTAIKQGSQSTENEDVANHTAPYDIADSNSTNHQDDKDSQRERHWYQLSNSKYSVIGSLGAIGGIGAAAIAYLLKLGTFSSFF